MTIPGFGAKQNELEIQLKHKVHNFKHKRANIYQFYYNYSKSPLLRIPNAKNIGTGFMKMLRIMWDRPGRGGILIGPNLDENGQKLTKLGQNRPN